MAIQNAKSANMPSDNIKRAIMKGTGELPGMVIEEIVYEGYGPGGVALYIEVMTDNKNRAVAEIRHILGKHNGNLGAAGSVAWKFEKCGLIQIASDKADEDKLMNLVLEAGASDMQLDGDMFSITTDPSDFESIREQIEAAPFEIESASITMLPKTTTKLEGKHAEQLLKLLEKLEDHEDVQNVYSDADMPDDIMENYSS
jgi:YebC/PmpR family DNA-binding regulatory protein